MRVFGMVLLCETMCSFAPSLAPCSPHLPRPASSMCLSRVSACPAVVFFFCGSVLTLLAAPARPACALCSSSCCPGPAALRPLSRLSPLPFSFSLSTLPARLPSLSVQRCHLCVSLACPTPAPPPRPYPFTWVLPRSPPLTPSWLRGALCGGGGCICVLDCGPVPPMRRRRLPGVVNPSEHAARMLNVFNAAPPCHAESCVAMYQVGG